MGLKCQIITIGEIGICFPSMMMARIVYQLGNILAIPLMVGLCVNIISLPATYRDGQSDSYLVEAYTRQTVREIDQTATNTRTDPSNPRNHVKIRDTINIDPDGWSYETPGDASSTKTKCPKQVQHDKLILTRSDIECSCDEYRGIERLRKRSIGEKYLKNCFRYKLGDIIPAEVFNSIEITGESTCVKILEEFVQLDETIQLFDDLFTNLLSRYNCHNGYSVKWNCDDCKKAYKDWLCATHLPPIYKDSEHAIKPCISFCERVEQRCPYLHPITREQYGGQPVFICRDPNIPFVPEITPDIPYSDPGKCYDLCHLNPDSPELTVDSLSKYDYNECPSLESITRHVQDEALPTEPTTTKPTIDDPDYEFSTGKKVDVPQKKVHAHHKKLMELLEVLANYKNQSKTHRYHADHSSIEHSKSQATDLHQTS